LRSRPRIVARSISTTSSSSSAASASTSYNCLGNYSLSTHPPSVLHHCLYPRSVQRVASTSFSRNPATRSITTASTPIAATSPISRNPLSQLSKRHCSYRRMCRSRHAGGEEGVGAGSMNVTHGREILPANVKPLHYDLTLEPDFEKFSYEGTVVIE
jgi:aminopeptidase 2